MYVIESIAQLQKLELYKRVSEVFENAFKKGELIYELEKDSDIQIFKKLGLTYQFKIINALLKRPINRKSENESENKKLNPFLKNEPDLTICDSLLLDHYKLLLNKFPNSRNHFLMVTKQFVKQDTLLSLKDLISIYTILSNINRDSPEEFFSFFNSGHQSGYSQIHKHIQFLTFPEYSDADTQVVQKLKPFADSFISDYEYSSDLKPLTSPDVAFKHFILPLPHQKLVTPELLLDVYNRLLVPVLNLFKLKKLLSEGQDQLLGENGELNPNISYNFILTTRYLLIIPRLNAKFDDCWANSLQFVGLFSGRNQEVKDKISSIGFQEFLSKVGFPNDNINYADVKL